MNCGCVGQVPPVQQLPKQEPVTQNDAPGGPSVPNDLPDTSADADRMSRLDSTKSLASLADDLEGAARQGLATLARYEERARAQSPQDPGLLGQIEMQKQRQQQFVEIAQKLRTFTEPTDPTTAAAVHKLKQQLVMAIKIGAARGTIDPGLLNVIMRNFDSQVGGASGGPVGQDAPIPTLPSEYLIETRPFASLPANPTLAQVADSMKALAEAGLEKLASYRATAERVAAERGTRDPGMFAIIELQSARQREYLGLAGTLRDIAAPTDPALRADFEKLTNYLVMALKVGAARGSVDTGLVNVIASKLKAISGGESVDVSDIERNFVGGGGNVVQQAGIGIAPADVPTPGSRISFSDLLIDLHSMSSANRSRLDNYRIMVERVGSERGGVDPAMLEVIELQQARQAEMERVLAAASDIKEPADPVKRAEFARYVDYIVQAVKIGSARGTIDPALLDSVFTRMRALQDG